MIVSDKILAADIFFIYCTNKFERDRRFTVNASVFASSSLGYAQTFVRDWGVEDDSGNSQFQFPFDVTVDTLTGSIFVVDTGNNRVQKFTDHGEFIRAWGTLGVLSTGQECIDEDNTGLLLYCDGEFLFPFGISVNPSTGDVYVADTGNNRIQRFTATGDFLGQWGVFGYGPGQFQLPFGVATNHITQTVYVADTFNHRIEQFTGNGQFVKQWGSSGTGSGMFQYPFGISIDSLDGTAIIADTGNNRIQVFRICSIIC